MNKRDLELVMRKCPRFESKEQAMVEKAVRARALLNANPELCDILENCKAKKRCKSAACPVCFREQRVRLVTTLLEYPQKRPKWRFVTIVMYADYLTDEQLRSFDVSKFKDKFRKLLEKAGIEGPVIGGIEPDYHESEQKWLPVLHLLVPKDKTALGVLRNLLKKRNKGHIRSAGTKKRPMLVKKVKERGSLYTYLFKSYWVQVSIYSDKAGKSRTMKKRLPKKQLVLSLETLHRIGFENLTFTYKVKKTPVSRAILFPKSLAKK